MSERRIYYFDNNATTRVAPEVVAIASLILLHWAAIAPELVPTAPPEIYRGWALEALERILAPV